MLRLLLLLALALLLARFLVRLGQLAAAAMREVPPTSAVPPPTALVPCRRCGVFVPRAEASVAPAGSGDGFLCRSCAGG